MTRTIAGVMLGLCLTGCTTLRISSRDHLTESGSSLMTSLSPDEASRGLVEQFGKRGYPLLDRRQVSGAETVLKFKGSRATITHVSRGSGGTAVVGSVFYARIATGSGQSRIALLGKPTLNGDEVCSDWDADRSLTVDPCESRIFSVDPSRNEMTGREEAEVIQGVTVELEVNGTAMRPPGPYLVSEVGTPQHASAPAAPQGPCVRRLGETNAAALERCSGG
ncbi:MAG TPA: hypothetical protein VFA20_33325 [Myxococcaceae bacterium]|nr:hypothetical protein [Myxococcaceae bacterium]